MPVAGTSSAAPAVHRTAAHPVALALLVGALVAASWAALWAWSASPYARYLAHPGWFEAESFAAFCTTVAVPAAAHAAAWALMIAAMMLPTTWPLLAMFQRVVAGRDDAPRLVARVVAGFAVAWLGFGVVAHAVDGVLRLAATSSGWFVAHGWTVSAAVLLGAGLFQFSALKYRCLERCRAPFGFVSSRWHGKSPPREAFAIGLAHGAFCVGCCWALMMLMFVVGMGSLGWMMALAAAMAAEKNLPAGRRLRVPLGLALVGGAAGVALVNL